MIVAIGDQGEIILTAELLDHLGLPHGGRVRVDVSVEGRLILAKDGQESRAKSDRDDPSNDVGQKHPPFET